jgi:hypothetical protein
LPHRNAKELPAVTVAAVFCLIVALLAGGLFLLELAVRLLPHILPAVGRAVATVLWLTWAGIAAGARALRRPASPASALRTA